MKSITVKSITVMGRLWFNTRLGHTQYSAEILVDGVCVYQGGGGGGNQYVWDAFAWLDRNGPKTEGKFKPYTNRQVGYNGNPEAPWIYCERKKIALYYNHVNL